MTTGRTRIGRIDWWVPACVALLGLQGARADSTLVAAQHGESAWSFMVRDEGDAPTSARIIIYSPTEERYLIPDGTPYWILNDRPGRRYDGARYFYAHGAFTLPTRAEVLKVYLRKGLEYEVLEQEVVKGSGPTTLRLARAFDLRKRGYFSGDGHVHPVSGTIEWARIPGQESFHDPKVISNTLLKLVTEAEDLAYVNLLASNSEGDEVHFGVRVTGINEPETDPDHILRVSEEYRSEVYGHMSVFGIRKLSDPVFNGVQGYKTQPFDYPTNHVACLNYKRQGAFASVAHPRRQKSIALEFPVDVALGSLHAVELQGYAVGTRPNAPIWEQLLSCGFDVVITAGTDSTLTFIQNHPPGGARVYVDMEGRPFTHEHWVDQLSRGKAFTTNGAMLFFTVDGKKPGEEIVLAEGQTKSVPVRIAVQSIFPWDTVTIRMNQRDALVLRSDKSGLRSQEFTGTLELSGPAWVYAHLEGPMTDDILGPQTAWITPTQDAYTNAIWVRSGDRPRRDAQSAAFFIDWINDNLAALERRNNYGSESNRNEVRTTMQRALAVFEERKAK